MTRLHLKYVQSYRGYHYFRRRGSPYVQLPGIPGSVEFMEAYQRALAAAPVAIGASKRSGPGSVSAAIAEYYGSQAFRSLTGGTPAHRRSILERFREQYGDKRLASLPPEFIIALLDTLPPSVARNWLKALRHLMQWCQSRKPVRIGHPGQDAEVGRPPHLERGRDRAIRGRASDRIEGSPCARSWPLHRPAARRRCPHGAPAHPRRRADGAAKQDRHGVGDPRAARA